MSDRIKGKVVWWRKSHGYGFIREETLTDDYFVHYKDVEFKDGRRYLKSGKQVSFILDRTEKGWRAREVREE